MWFEKVGGRTRVGRMIYLSKEEYEDLMEEANKLKSIIKTSGKVTLSDVIRVRCFYSKKVMRLK